MGHQTEITKKFDIRGIARGGKCAMVWAAMPARAAAEEGGVLALRRGGSLTFCGE
jgi:hypothetical protein